MLRPIIKDILQKLEKVLGKVEEEKTKNFIQNILDKKRIFLTGQGRSGLVADAFAMRLVHLGFNAFIVGEPTTPSITKNDLLVAVSGSGGTEVTFDIVEEAKRVGAFVCLITANKESKIAKISDLVIEIKAKTKLDIKNKGKESLEPLGTLFEQCALLYLDSVVGYLMKRLGKTELELKKRHANLE